MSLAAVATLAGPLGGLMSRQAMAATSDGRGAQLEPAQSPYGPLFPTRDLATGLPLLKLPRGFSYRSFSWRGDMMGDGLRVPGSHDGMAVVQLTSGRVPDMLLIRNHEVGGGTPFAPAGNLAGRYAPVNAGGGCTVLRVRNGSLVDHRVTIGGTRTNCAGGKTPWGTWLTCEETTTDNSGSGGRKHGYVFEVSPDPTQTQATPIVGMGRFSHEATATDPRTGYVYLTEDARNICGFYRYKPSSSVRGYGALAQGGTLQAAKVVGIDRANLLALGGSNHVGRVGQELEIEWVTIEEPDASPTSYADPGAAASTVSGPYAEARQKGALRMSRGEGLWYMNGAIAVVDTSFGYNGAGAAGNGLGAVWVYTPSTTNPERGTLKLLYAAAARVAGNNPDNITVSPRGGLLYCEDGSAVADEFGVGQRLMGLTPSGEAYIFCKNNVQLSPSEVAGMGRSTAFIAAEDHRDSEFCGATFDPSGRILFVNIQTPGITFAISGPWGRGNL